jgi:hypothetical protein
MEDFLCASCIHHFNPYSQIYLVSFARTARSRKGPLDYHYCSPGILFDPNNERFLEGIDQSNEQPRWKNVIMVHCSPWNRSGFR